MPPSVPRERALAAIVGSFVADVATMPMHWIYDVSKIASLVGDKEPAFFPTPSSPFYTHPFGTFSCYGHETFVYLEEASKGEANLTSNVMDGYFKYYSSGPGSAGVYQNSPTKAFVKNYAAGLRFPECGAKDSQSNAIAHMVPVVALLAGKPNMLELVDATIRVVQNTDEAVAFGCAAARVLEKAILYGTSGPDAVKQVAEELANPNRDHPLEADTFLSDGLNQAIANVGKSSLDYTKMVGSSCGYPNNLLSGCHILAQGLLFAESTRQVIMAGGDNCSRSMFVQAVNAALEGLDAIPEDWKAKTTDYSRVLALAQALVAHRSD